MLQSLNHYQVERLLQLRQEEMSRKMRNGLYRKQLTDDKSTTNKQTRTHRRFWHKWFGSRRLDTSWK